MLSTCLYNSPVGNIGLLKKDDFLETKSHLEIEIMKNIKKTFDPKNILNQNKIFEL